MGYGIKSFVPRGPFLEAPGNYRARWAVLFSIPDGSFKTFESCTVKLSAKETKWTSLEVRTHPSFLETLISKEDTGPVNLPVLSRNGPKVSSLRRQITWKSWLRWYGTLKYGDFHDKLNFLNFSWVQKHTIGLFSPNLNKRFGAYRGYHSLYGSCTLRVMGSC